MVRWFFYSINLILLAVLVVLVMLLGAVAAKPLGLLMIGVALWLVLPDLWRDLQQ